MPKNILILYTSYGTGHYMAAQAIAEHLAAKFPEANIKVLDPLTFSRPFINRIFAWTGRLVATRFRHFRSKLYKRKMYRDYFKPSRFMNFCTKFFWTHKLQKFLVDFYPDFIISTQVGPTGLIAAHKHLFHAPLISVFTDYGVHRYYTVCHNLVDLFFVPTAEIQQQMINLGIPESKLRVTGIPVRAAFLQSSRTKKCPSEGLPVFLFVCGGGQGYINAFEYFKQLLDLSYPCSYIFVAGHNCRLLKKAERLAKHAQTMGQVLGFVNDLDELMQQSSLVFGKPGGLLTSEALSLGAPFCALSPIPGQESLNAKFLVDHYFGFAPANIAEFQSLLKRLETNEIDLNSYRKTIHDNFHKFSFPDEVLNKIN